MPKIASDPELYNAESKPPKYRKTIGQLAAGVSIDNNKTKTSSSLAKPTVLVQEPAPVHGPQIDPFENVNTKRRHGLPAG